MNLGRPRQKDHIQVVFRFTPIVLMIGIVTGCGSQEEVSFCGGKKGHEAVALVARNTKCQANLKFTLMSEGEPEQYDLRTDFDYEKIALVLVESVPPDETTFVYVGLTEDGWKGISSGTGP